MIKWLFEMIVGWPWCVHKWDLYEDVAVVDEDGDKIGRRIYLRCSKCGDFKVRRFR